MAKFYKGNIPNLEEGWKKVLKHTDQNKVEWIMFRKKQLHTDEWATYKVVAMGRAEFKANYWLAKNEITGQLGFSRDHATMRDKHQNLYKVVENYLDNLIKEK